MTPSLKGLKAVEAALRLGSFVAAADELRAKGVDLIACVSVNDVHVMSAWGKAQNVRDVVAMVADGNGDFARAMGVARPGGGIGIHGVRRSRSTLARAWIHVAHDLGLQSTWGPTDGCIALANEDIEYLYARVTVGTPIEIVP